MYQKNKQLIDNLFPGLTVYLGSVKEVEQEDVSSVDWLEKIPLEGWRAAIVYGFDDGRLVESLLKLQPDRSIIVVELFPGRIKKAMEKRDLSFIFENKSFFLVCKEDYRDAAFDVMKVMRGNCLEDGMVVMSLGKSEKEGVWSNFERELNDFACQFGVNAATHKRYDLKWVENFFKNVEVGASDASISLLFDEFKWVPAVVVGSGPSFDNHIKMLRIIKDNVLVIAAGSAVVPLMKNGIKPDLFVSMDAQEANYEHFRGLDMKEIVLAYCANIFPGCLRGYLGRKLSFSLDVFPWMIDFYKRVGENKGVLVSGPSVANVAIDLANKMGCRPVFFVGLDFAFGDKTHSKDCRHVMDTDCMENLFQIKGNNGGMVSTNLGFYSMKVWLERYIEMNAGVYINVGGGARIEGAKVMRPGRVIRKCRVKGNYSGVIDEIVARHGVFMDRNGIRREIEREKRCLRKELGRLEKRLWVGRRRGEDLLEEVEKANLFFRTMVGEEIEKEKWRRMRGEGGEELYRRGMEVIDRLRRVIR